MTSSSSLPAVWKSTSGLSQAGLSQASDEVAQLVLQQVKESESERTRGTASPKHRVSLWPGLERAYSWSESEDGTETTSQWSAPAGRRRGSAASSSQPRSPRQQDVRDPSRAAEPRREPQKGSGPEPLGGQRQMAQQQKELVCAQLKKELRDRLRQLDAVALAKWKRLEQEHQLNREFLQKQVAWLAAQRAKRRAVDELERARTELLSCAPSPASGDLAAASLALGGRAELEVQPVSPAVGSATAWAAGCAGSWPGPGRVAATVPGASAGGDGARAGSPTAPACFVAWHGAASSAGVASTSTSRLLPQAVQGLGQQPQPPKCPKGHLMQHSSMTPSARWHSICDICGADSQSQKGPGGGNARWKCEDCDYDVCFRCRPWSEAPASSRRSQGSSLSPGLSPTAAACRASPPAFAACAGAGSRH
ncbi:unnamed protein product [Prorocentrum cordatum]|uniref:ZZ-type domain-containing protein n=1 Tax=Prorocentrum cordatum TaxID=2364126 RepID=A0ABN9X1E0_9DINO|nr:unnamed protein product [Polarella glacialis]